MFHRLGLFLLVVLCLLSQPDLHTTAHAAVPLVAPANARSAVTASASEYLAAVQDQCHSEFYVYLDADSACNHFAARGLVGVAPPMVENDTQAPALGMTAIRATFNPQAPGYGGWYFLNGVLTGSQTAPQLNWGTFPDAGFNLSGATRIRFCARGAQGGERVTFFALGVGHGDPAAPFPDSGAQVSTGVLTLGTTWNCTYELSLTGRNLSYVLGGFGWVASSADNATPITFYLDEIAFNKPRLTEPHFLVSFATQQSMLAFDTVNRNVGYTYDNAVAALAFLASGDAGRSRSVLDALRYAMLNDRHYTDKRLRNGYQGGDLALPPGWTPNGKVGTVRMPGWYDSQAMQWTEDAYTVSSHTGNIGWAMLAFLGGYQTLGDAQYLTAAIELGAWVESNCRDTRGAGGYTAGYEGRDNETPVKLLYKSTEHNLDLYAAFLRLYLITNDQIWLDRALHAKGFVMAMWDGAGSRFAVGTGADGVTKATNNVLDAQAWSVQALREQAASTIGALTYAELALAVDGGFDFNDDRDGVWFEGTAQMALSYGLTGQAAKRQTAIQRITSEQLPNGGVLAASIDGLTTGLDISGAPWRYYRRAHVGATGWLVFAAANWSPFWPFATAVTGAVSLQGRTVSVPTGIGYSVAAIRQQGAALAIDQADAAGSLAFTLLPGRMYTLDVIAPGYLPARRSFTLSPGTTTHILSPVLLVAGDVVADGVVNITDIIALIERFGSRPSNQVDSLGRAVDINGDGVVNIQDVALALGNFGRTAPLPWP